MPNCGCGTASASSMRNCAARRLGRPVSSSTMAMRCSRSWVRRCSRRSCRATRKQWRRPSVAITAVIDTSTGTVAPASSTRIASSPRQMPSASTCGSTLSSNGIHWRRSDPGMMPLSSPARRTSASLISSTSHCGSTTAIASRVLLKACAIRRSDSSASRWAVTSFSVPSTCRARPWASRSSARPRTRSQRLRPSSSCTRKLTSMSGCAPRRCNCQASRIAAMSSTWARPKNCSSDMPWRAPAKGSSVPSATSTRTRPVAACHSHTLSPLAHSASCTRCSADWGAAAAVASGRVARGKRINVIVGGGWPCAGATRHVGKPNAKPARPKPRTGVDCRCKPSIEDRIDQLTGRAGAAGGPRTRKSTIVLF